MALEAEADTPVNLEMVMVESVSFCWKQAGSMKQPAEENLPIVSEKARILSLVLLVMPPA